MKNTVTSCLRCSYSSSHTRTLQSTGIVDRMTSDDGELLGTRIASSTWRLCIERGVMVPTERARPLAFIRRRCGAMDKRAWTIPDRPHKENVHTCRFVFVRCVLFVYVGVNRSWRAFPRSRANLFVFAQSSTAAYLKFCWLGRDSNCGGRGENRENYRPNTNSARTEVDGWLRIVNAAWLKL